MTEAASMVYVTCADADEAAAIARAVVGEKLAACANILAGMRAVYRWEGAVQESDETVLILKTSQAGFDVLSARIKALHSYDVPCIVELPLARGNADYLAWIMAETTPV